MFIHFERFIVVALATLASAQSARAVEFFPSGETPDYADPDDYFRDLEPQNWPGTVLASRVTPFEIRTFSEQAGRDAFVTGTLTNEVIRETESGYLSFHYKVDITGGSTDVRDFEGITLRDFNTYFTDFRADVTRNETGVITRDNGGDSFFFRIGERSEHWLVVRTDAPDFAEGGSFRYQVDWDGLNEAGSAVVPAFTPVPEPATAGALGVIGAAALLRRRRRA